MVSGVDWPATEGGWAVATRYGVCQRRTATQCAVASRHHRRSVRRGGRGPVLQRLLKEHAGGAAILTLHPLPVGNVLVMRHTAKTVGGESRRWQTVVGGPVDPGSDSPNRNRQQKWLTGVGVVQRTWDDLTYGTLASDGHRVYSIEDMQVNYGGIRSPVYQVVAADMNHFGVFVSLRGAQDRSIFAIGWRPAMSGPANWSGSWVARTPRGSQIRFF